MEGPLLVPGAEQVRADLYHLFGALLLECPSRETLEELLRAQLLARLAEGAADEALGRSLRAMQSALAKDGAIDEVRSDYGSLFLGLGPTKVPPWESVYRSPEQLVWQTPAYSVLEHYARARLGYDGMKQLPPDHVGRELLFMASLAAQVADRDADQAEPDEAPALDRRAALLEQRVFLEQHVLVWVPRFVEDLGRCAATEFYRHLAKALAAHLTAERRWAKEQAAALAD